MERKGIDIRDSSAQQRIRTAAMNRAAFQDTEGHFSACSWQTAWKQFLQNVERYNKVLWIARYMIFMDYNF